MASTAAVSVAPGPRGVPLLHNTLDLWQRDRLATLVRRREQYGDVVRTRIVGRDVLLINDPDAIRHVLQHNHTNYEKGPAYALLGFVVGEGLLTSEGSFWLRQRRLIQPAFHKRYLARFAEVMVRRTEECIDDWRPGAEIDVATEMMRLTFSIVGEALFSAEVEGEAGEIGELVTHALGLFDRFVALGVLLPRRVVRRDRIPVPAVRRVTRRLDEIVLGIIERRRTDPRPHDDLLGMLMSVRDEDGSAMTDTQLKDEVMTLILAGHETTASALTWTLALLARHRDVESRVVEEHRAVLGDRPPTLADVANLTLTERVVKESMRLYPPAWIIARKARAADEIAGFTVPAGAVIQIPPWSLHRHPGHWDAPERFDPDRFSPERSAGRHPWAYLPFGAGARGCIGKAFAMLEATLVLATMLRRFVLTPRSTGMPDPHPTVTLRPRGGWPVRVAAR